MLANFDIIAVIIKLKQTVITIIVIVVAIIAIEKNVIR